MMEVFTKYISANEGKPRFEVKEMDTCTNVPGIILDTLSPAERQNVELFMRDRDQALQKLSESEKQKAELDIRTITELCTTSKNLKGAQCIWDRDSGCFGEVNTECENIATRALCFLNGNPKVQCDWDESSSTCSSLGN